MVVYFFVHPRLFARLEWSINRCLHCKSSWKSWILFGNHPTKNPTWKQPALPSAWHFGCLTWESHAPSDEKKCMVGSDSEKVKVAMDKKVSCFKMFTGFPIVLNSSTKVHQSFHELYNKKKQAASKVVWGFSQPISDEHKQIRLLLAIWVCWEGNEWKKAQSSVYAPPRYGVSKFGATKQIQAFPKMTNLGGIPTNLEMYYTPLLFSKIIQILLQVIQLSPTPQNQNPCRTWILRMASCKMSLWNTALLKNRLKLKPWLSPQCERSGK